MNFKAAKSKNDSMHTGGDAKVPANVNSLRKLFESNFKLSAITKPFKSKNNHSAGKSVHVAKNSTFDEPADCHRFQKFGDNKENRNEDRLTRAASPSGCYLNCKIENCCCKTFFREYSETPTFRSRPPLPKLPLRECNGNSRFDRRRPERWSAASCSSYNLSKQRQLRDLHLSQHPPDHDAQNHKPADQSRNKFYNINYEFYKSKSQEIFDETPVSAVSTKRLDRILPSRCGRSVNLLEKIENSEHADAGCRNEADGRSSHCDKGSALPFQKTEASGFVNFTTATINEGGYVKTARDFRTAKKGVWNYLGDGKNVERVGPSQRKNERRTGEQRTRLQEVDSNEPPVERDSEAEAHHIGAFDFKCRLPKLKTIGLRENSHPYSTKKPRLTVKGVKNRNMRNGKRRQKLTEESTLSRSQTFSGYDNFAYRRSVTDLSLSKQLEETDIRLDDSADAALSAAKPSVDGNVAKGKRLDAIARVPRPASISVVGVDGPHFHLDSRMTSYEWPVTSFYIERSEKQSSKEAPRRSSSTFDLENKHSYPDKNVNPVTRKTNLKRYCSLGYLKEDEFVELNFTKHRRSLENVNKASSMSEIQNIQEVDKSINRRKLQNSDVHMHALFAAVEHGYVERTQTILESSDVNVNSVNSDGLSPLDVALLSNNKSLVKLLIKYGAQEGRKYYEGDMRNHLCHLLHEAESRVRELSDSLRPNMDCDQTTSTPSSSIASVKIGDGAPSKTFSIWERRAKGLKRMLTGFEQIRPPDPPSVVSVEVTSTSSIMVYFTESNNENSSMTTKFKVQLSTDSEFLCLCGHYEIADTRQLKYHIMNLCKGQSYYVRVASGNIKGYSAYRSSTPPFIVPSSWQDITKRDSRFSVSLKDTLDGIFTSVLIEHPYLRNNADLFAHGVDLFSNQRRKKPSIKQLFTVSSKFQKHLKRGVYLACLLYHEDKVLVTNDNFLPVIEVDENYPRKIHNDFYWFFKVGCNWNDLKWVKNDLERLPNSSAVFRLQLLQAAVHMQTALGIQELGTLYYKMLRDVEGTIVISIINHIHSPKSLSVLNLRWLPLAKLNKKANLANSLQANLSDVLVASIPEQIIYHQVSKIKLPRGLYLGYLKMRSSVDSLEVLVPFKTPNILPHCKIRDNPHVTAEEWEWLVDKENLRESLASATYQQRLFVKQMVITARKLFTHMDISDEEAASHRLYDAEVIEVNEDISLIMIVPSAEISCSVSDQRKVLLQRPHLLPLTVQAFEMIHFETFQPDLISLYSRLSCVIEMDLEFAQFSLRQAFSDSEVNSSKYKLLELENLQTRLNTAWKDSKWLLDVISFARNRLAVPRISVRELLSVHPKRVLSSVDPNCCILSPNTKSDESRGSWPDAGVGQRLSRLPNKISRSEQHLKSGVVSAISAHSPTKCNVETPLPMTCAKNEEAMVVSYSSSSSASESRSCARRKKYSSQYLTRIKSYFSALSHKAPMENHFFRVEYAASISRPVNTCAILLYYLRPVFFNFSETHILVAMQNLYNSKFEIAWPLQLKPPLLEDFFKLKEFSLPFNLELSRFTVDSSSLSSMHSTSSDELSVSSSRISSNHGTTSDAVNVPVLKPAIIKVHAAYDTGFDSPMHFKFHVSPRTTARDIVDMFIKQANMSIIMKGQERPIFSDEDLSNFCLTVVDGQHERSLHDDFHLWQHKQPWKGGRLYVRRRSSSLGTIEDDSQSSYV